MSPVRFLLGLAALTGAVCVSLAMPGAPASASEVLDLTAPSATSDSFAGYRVEAGRHVVRAVVTVPTITCDSARTAVLTGITSYNNRGDRLGAFGLRSRCAQGESIHEAVTLTWDGELEPIEDLAVAAGDIVLLVRRYDDFEVRIEERFINRTQDWAIAAVSVDFRAIARSNEIGDALADVGGTVLPLPSFEPHRVRAVSADGTALDLARPTRVRLVDDAGAVILIPTELHNRPRFSLERKHS